MKRKRTPNSCEKDTEEYESSPRFFSEENSECKKELLPVRSLSSGRWKIQVIETNEDQEADELKEDQKEKKEKVKNNKKEMTGKNKRNGRTSYEEESIVEEESEDLSDSHIQSNFLDQSSREKSSNHQKSKSSPILTQQSIAQICLKIIEDPIENLSLFSSIRSFVNQNIDKKKEMESSSENDANNNLVLLSLLAVFKDILPSYHIRELTDQEKQAKVSKEVQKQRNYESCLVSNYTTYIKYLQKCIESYNPHIKLVSLQCLCEVSVSCKDFNLHEEIFHFLVKKIIFAKFFNFTKSKKALGLVQNMLAEIFQNDENGKDSLFVVQQLSDHLGSNSYAPTVHPVVLQSLCHLQIAQGSLGNEGPKIPTTVSQLVPGARHISRSENKKLKEKLSTIKETHEKSLVIEAKDRTRRYREVVKHLFRIYFGILKWHDQNATETNSLLPVCMKGLGKFTHLIGVEYFGDLMAALRSLATVRRINDLTTGMQVLIAAFKILDMKVESSFFDLKSFYVFLFELMLRCLSQNDKRTIKKNNQSHISEDRSSSVDFDLVDQVFTLMFLKKSSGSLPNQRILSFGQLLGQLAVESNSSEGWIEILIKMIQKYSKLHLEMFDDFECENEAQILVKESSDPDCPRANALDREALLKLLDGRIQIKKTTTSGIRILN